MAEIPKDFGQGGANLTPEGSGTPSAKEILDDIADDLADVQVATIATADAGASYTANEQTLLNEIKTALNAIAAKTVRTTKEA
jgi:hypothetical protein